MDSQKYNEESWAQPLRPFLKWAGGKSWLAPEIKGLLPDNYGRYIEPFLGGGSIFLELQPTNALLGDANSDLIECYRALADNWQLVFRYLREHHKNHSNEYYYRIRSFFPKSPYTRAARFIYLNRTCWNGLFRVNKKGIFNVPIGTKNDVLYPYDQFSDISDSLANCELFDSDFEDLIERATEDDVVFVDPPYTVKHNHNGFLKYNETLFSWFDQIRLYSALERAANRGASIIGTNALHDSVTQLYAERFTIRPITRHSNLSADKRYRRPVQEMLFYTGGM